MKAALPLGIARPLVPVTGARGGLARRAPLGLIWRRRRGAASTSPAQHFHAGGTWLTQHSHSGGVSLTYAPRAGDTHVALHARIGDIHVRMPPAPQPVARFPRTARMQDAAPVENRVHTASVEHVLREFRNELRVVNRAMANVARPEIASTPHGAPILTLPSDRGRAQAGKAHLVRSRIETTELRHRTLSVGLPPASVRADPPRPLATATRQSPAARKPVAETHVARRARPRQVELLRRRVECLGGRAAPGPPPAAMPETTHRPTQHSAASVQRRATAPTSLFPAPPPPAAAALPDMNRLVDEVLRRLDRQTRDERLRRGI
jgi:hypothetical protein